MTTGGGAFAARAEVGKLAPVEHCVEPIGERRFTCQRRLLERQPALIADHSRRQIVLPRDTEAIAGRSKLTPALPIWFGRYKVSLQEKFIWWRFR
jgi:hypothetical protein